METLFILIPLGLTLLGLAIWAFIWAVNHNQFDDFDSPAQNIIFDDRVTEEERRKNTIETPQSDTPKHD
ncbi:MAG: cbb3-type cytochrome oxidase assembly protein CcoS [Gammaproteobacteria bacterium]|nr:cbb3-type cytochrome oxidase assembly protein CcoS [Gammaproteobacteria bacterium]